MVHLLLFVIYLAFVSLGLPDGLLGAAWPSMYPQLRASVSSAGIISMIICMGTVLSSLFADRLTCRLGTAKVTVISVAMTAAALFGFSFSHSFWMLCLFAIPYGLGAGSVDACLNHYVAIHYSSRHMSWLHCMWGIGASVGPYIMGFLLSGGQHWSAGYRLIGMMQIVLTAILIFSLPLWNSRHYNQTRTKAIPLRQAMKLPGAWDVMIAFFCYCALEQTAALWSASYLWLHSGFSEETAASLGSLFFLGMTLGRAVSGFLTIKLRDAQMIHLGFLLITIGIIILLLPLKQVGTIIGLLIIGLGCAPIYPCVIHSTPDFFGTEHSQALIGIEMASAYVGTALMPPLFGIIAEHFSISLMGIYLLVLLLIMVWTYERLLKTTTGATL
jgi:fucose permease